MIMLTLPAYRKSYPPPCARKTPQSKLTLDAMWFA